MTAILRALGVAAQHGRFILVVGLAAGILMPGVALAMRPWLQELVAGLLFLAALRIGPRRAFGAIGDMPKTLSFALAFQLALPLAAIFIFWMTGSLGNTLATSLVLMLCASSISGSPNLTIMTGHDPAPALRLLVLGTAILPLTVIPVFWLLPALGGVVPVIEASGRLLGVIGAATIAAFALRRFALRDPGPETLNALDGLSAVALGIVVIGLMSAAGPALFETPGRFFLWLGVACLANFSLQLAASKVLSPLVRESDIVPLSIVAGNRNIALFLVALPRDVTDPLLLFVGCYQIPMYLTPILLRRYYARFTSRQSPS